MLGRLENPRYLLFAPKLKTQSGIININAIFLLSYRQWNRIVRYKFDEDDLSGLALLHHSKMRIYNNKLLQQKYSILPELRKLKEEIILHTLLEPYFFIFYNYSI